MKDSVVRGRLLRLLFERRNEDLLPFGAAEGAISPPAGINSQDWLQAAAQLAEYGLINWQPLKDDSGSGRMGGLARITEAGVAVINGGEAPPIDIRFC